MPRRCSVAGGACFGRETEVEGLCARGTVLLALDVALWLRGLMLVPRGNKMPPMMAGCSTLSGAGAAELAAAAAAGSGRRSIFADPARVRCCSRKDGLTRARGAAWARLRSDATPTSSDISTGREISEELGEDARAA